MDRVITDKRLIRSRHIPFIIGGILLAVVVAWVIFGSHQSTLNVEREQLTVSNVEEREFRDYVRISGRVAPIEVVQIAPIEGGVVVEKVVEEGAAVRKGDVIVRLANSNLDLQILNAEAELAEKQNLLRNTQVAMQQDRLNNEMELASLDMEEGRKRRNFQQQERLYKERLTAFEEYEKAREDYELVTRKRRLVTQRLSQDSIYRSVQMDQMEDNLAAMRRNLQLVRERKDKLEVRSTIDGELGLLNVKLGQNIASGVSIGQVNDLSAFRIEASVDEHYIDRVRQGLRASFSRVGKMHEVFVRKVFPEVREGRFQVDFTLKDTSAGIADTAGEKFRPGQTFYLDLELGQPSQAVIIPRGTFFQTTGGSWIFVLDKDGRRAYRRQIRIGRQNPQYYEVLEGLQPGEQVVTSGYESFRDNEVLNIR